MLKVGGFPEYLPWQQEVMDAVQEIIRRNFSQYGYQHINTPAVEKNTTLTAKWGEESSKQIYGLYGLAQWSEDAKDYALHFDLTVPFARYVLDYTNDLSFPFKRWQMQPVRRGERQQRGRFKEFIQADIDTIRPGESTQSYLYYDAETIVVLYKVFTEILQQLNFATGLTVRCSNKKIVTWLLADLSVEQLTATLAWIDKYYKMSHEEFVAWLAGHSGSTATADKILQLLQQLWTDITSVRNLSDEPLYQQWLDELETVTSLVAQLATAWQVPLNLTVDAAIVRGLDYYTGTVFETFLDTMPSYGSVCSGGRYEHLTQHLDAKKDFSGVGGSIGLDRFMSWVFDEGLVQAQSHTQASYLLVNFAETFPSILQISTKLLAQWYRVSIYPEPDKLKKQFSYADKWGFSHVVICGESEAAAGIYKIKDLVSWNDENINM